jgi:ribosomal protein L23
MDFNKLKVYGFPRHVMTYKMYNPTKIRYLKSRDLGYFEAPKYSKNPELRYLVDRYKQRLEYEKYMNPKGIKTTVTSNFPKFGPSIDYADPKIFLIKSPKIYEEDEVKFFVDKNLSKYEIKQFLEKCYKLKVNKVSTAILPGKVQALPLEKQRKFFRTKDVKKAVVKLDFPVDEKYRKLEKTKN